MQSCRWLPMFQRNLPLPSLGTILAVLIFSKSIVPRYIIDLSYILAYLPSFDMLTANF
jgi:hypothetical protein